MRMLYGLANIKLKKYDLTRKISIFNISDKMTLLLHYFIVDNYLISLLCKYNLAIGELGAEDKSRD
jgi:hypothetical protein